MKIYHVELTDEAEQDIREIAASCIRDDLDLYAAKLVREFFESADRLSIFPNGHPRYEPDPAARYVKVDHYYMFYEVDERRRVVTVLKIIYQRRDLRQMRLR